MSYDNEMWRSVLSSSDEEIEVSPTGNISPNLTPARPLPMQAPFAFRRSTAAEAPATLRRSNSDNPQDSFCVSTLSRELNRFDVAGSSNAKPTNKLPTELEETLKCGICFEVYGTPHLPKNLECGHCFCEPCIRKIKRTNSVDCPNCRHTTSVTSSRLRKRQLATNYSLLAVVERLERMHGEKTEVNLRICIGCDMKTKRLWVCKTCEQNGFEKIDTIFCSDCILESHETHTKERFDHALIEARKSAKQRINRKLQEDFQRFQEKLSKTIRELQAIETRQCEKSAYFPLDKKHKHLQFLNDLDNTQTVEECRQIEEKLQKPEATLDLLNDLLSN